MMNTETLDKIYLEWSQFTQARTALEIELREAMYALSRAAQGSDTIPSARVMQIVNAALASYRK